MRQLILLFTRMSLGNKILFSRYGIDTFIIRIQDLILKIFDQASNIQYLYVSNVFISVW